MPLPAGPCWADAPFPAGTTGSSVHMPRFPRHGPGSRGPPTPAAFETARSSSGPLRRQSRRGSWAPHAARAAPGCLGPSPEPGHDIVARFSSIHRGGTAESDSRGRLYVLALNSQLVDSELHHIPGAQIARRLLSETHSRRRTGADQIARHEGYISTDVAHEFVHPKYHGSRRAILKTVAIHRQPQPQVIHIAHLIAGHEPRAHRPERVTTLALEPLSAMLQLKLALGNIVDNDITCDVVGGAITPHVARNIAYYHTKFNLPVCLDRAGGYQDGIIRPA